MISALKSSVLVSILLIATLATASAATAQGGGCGGISFSDPQKVFEQKNVVLLGEMHGTREIPNFVADVVCRALEWRNVTVALEISSGEDARLQRYLASEGAPKDRDALLAGPFWTSPYKDGRSSQAMLDLIERLRVLSRGARHLRVVPIGMVEPSDHAHPMAGQARTADEVMADNLAAALKHRANGHELFLVLTGNFHNRLGKGTPWDHNFEPMGYLLARSGSVKASEVVALNVRYPGGKARYCTRFNDPESCQPNNLLAAPEWKADLARHNASEPPGVNLQASEYYSGYVYFTSNLNESPPAEQSRGGEATTAAYASTATPRLN